MSDVWQDPPLPEEEIFFTGHYADGMPRGVRYVTDWMGRKKEIEVILPEIPTA